MKGAFNKQHQQIVRLLGDSGCDEQYEQNAVNNGGVTVYDHDRRRTTLLEDVPLSLSTKPSAEHEESTDMAFHHTLIPRVASVTSSGRDYQTVQDSENMKHNDNLKICLFQQ